MNIRFLTPGDTAAFSALISIFNTVFEHEDPVADEAYLKTVLEEPSFAAVAAFVDGVVAGGLTVYELKPYYHKKPQAYIYDVGVAPAWQGKGIGKALIAFVCEHYKALGFEAAYVEAEADDADAIVFYRRTPFSSEAQATHFTYALG